MVDLPRKIMIFSASNYEPIWKPSFGVSFFSFQFLSLKLKIKLNCISNFLQELQFAIRSPSKQAVFKKLFINCAIENQRYCSELFVIGQEGHFRLLLFLLL